MTFTSKKPPSSNIQTDNKRIYISTRGLLINLSPMFKIIFNMRYIVVLLLVLAFLIPETHSVPAYPCDIEGCQTCSYPGVCGSCKNNWLLQINMTTTQTYCAKVFCADNCQTCYQNYTCQVCDTGYYVDKEGYCVLGSSQSCSANCLNCESLMECNLCGFGYNIQNGYCVPNVPIATIGNCMVGFYEGMCQLCTSGYMVDPQYQCTETPTITCAVDNCYQCNTTSDSCSTCDSGYTLNSSNKCTKNACTITNCATCSDASTCSACMQGYNLQGNACLLKKYSCSVANCMACSFPNICAQCNVGYYPVYSDKGAPTQCMKITQAVGFQQEYVKYCSQLGIIPFGTGSALTFGCVTCMDNFINVGGLCVANLTQTNYECNVNYCEYCVQNNFCGKCSTGYTLLSNTGGRCWKNYSPVPNCMLTTSQALCAMCSSGYAVNGESSCVAIGDITCNIVGCDFCTASNQCQECMGGFNAVTDNSTGKITACEAPCNISNCYECFGNSICGICENNYVLNDDSTQCLLATNVSVNCTSTYENCAECNAAQCTSCMSGYTLNTQNNKCCLTVAQNAIGCKAYKDQCSNECTQCAFGYYKLSGQCITLPCKIANCAYCFGSQSCLLCEEGYTLSNNACTQYTVPATCTKPYCTACNSSGACTTCISGYTLYEGYCVCSFQNCLACMGDGFCNVCAYPTSQTYLASKACLPQILPFTLCQVNFCTSCSTKNVCSECDLGYSLQKNGTCLKNTCNSTSNCQLCSADRNLCYLCNTGYIQEGIFAGNCTALSANYACQVQGCAVCNTSSTCQVCIENFFLTSDKKCTLFSCIDNCLFCFENSTCTYCNVDYYLTDDMTCVKSEPAVVTCNITYCFKCELNSNNDAICTSCYLGMQPTTDGTACTAAVCPLDNCNLCLPLESFTACFVCEQGYFLNSYFQCVPYSPPPNTVQCDVYNCFYCYAANKCGSCAPGWNATNGMCQTNLFCTDDNCQTCTNSTYCVACADSYTLTSSGTCTPACNITYCSSCKTTTTCAVCNNTFQLSTDNTSCVCADTFEPVDGVCACPTGSTIYNDTCFPCNVTNCQNCSAINTCEICTSNLVLNNNQCGCLSTFQLTNGSCVCADGSTPFGVGADAKCVGCDVSYCSTCNSTNQCVLCSSTFILEANNTCVCPTNASLVNNECQCPQGNTLFNQTCISCDVSNCSLCQSPDYCSTCANKFILGNGTCTCPSMYTIYENICYECDVDYCTTCNSTNYCFQCKDSFTNTNGTCTCASETNLFNQTCVACNISNCVLCEEANVCTTCSLTYNLTGNVCVPCDVRGCSKCITPNFCETCLNGEAISTLGTCLDCTVTNCAVCSSATTCQTCNDGLALDNVKSSCVNCSTSGCQTCNSAGQCVQCIPTYQLTSSNTCVACAFPCKTCNTNGTCATCRPPYSQTPSNNECFLCSVQNCLICSSSSKTTCTTCASGYTLSSGKCNKVCTGSFCQSCPTSSSFCQKCMNGYAPVNGVCTQCTAANCLQCLTNEVGTCSLCASGYYINDGNCKACPYPNCQECNATVCTSFKASTKQIAFNSNGVITPALCNQECSNCSAINPEFCLNCMPGYANKEGLCISCSYPCKTCADNDETQCLTCYSDGYLSNGKCLTCTNSSNCLTCSETALSTCTNCPYFFVKNGTSCSRGCPSFCLDCSSSTVCDVCLEGFAPNANGVCVPCLANCRHCSGLEPGLCIECGTGFYLNSNNNCVECPEFCSTCNPLGKCQECMTGYTLTQQFTCSSTCKIPCASCSLTDSSKCTSCIAGYSLNSATFICSPVTSCGNGACDICPFGYTLSGGNCVECNPDSNCGRCSVSDVSVCLSCKPGQYLDSNQCIACPTGCETCSSGINCLSCQSGYTAQVQPVLTQITCVKCSSPCSTCTRTSTTCTSCQSGFTLRGWKCVSSFNYGFSITLNTTLSTFYSNYQTFLEAIASSQSTPETNVTTLTAISTGSVIVAGNVSTLAQSDSSLSQTQYNELSSTLSDGSSIAGMSIISSSIDVNGGQVPSSSSGPNLALILGICIPVGVILIGLIIYCACCRKSSAPEAQYSEKNMQPGTTVRQTFELSRDNTQRIDVQVQE